MAEKSNDQKAEKPAVIAREEGEAVKNLSNEAQHLLTQASKDKQSNKSSETKDSSKNEKKAPGLPELELTDKQKPNQEPNAGNIEHPSLNVNGSLRCGSNVYDIRSGALYQKGEKNPCGQLNPDLSISLKEKGTVKLAEQENVLLQFSIDGDKSGKVHRIIGMGPVQYGKNGEPIAGGLRDADALLSQVDGITKQAGGIKDEYVHGRTLLTRVFGLDGAAKNLEQITADMNNNGQLLRRQLDYTFANGFDAKACDKQKLDRCEKNIDGLIKAFGTDAESVSAVARENKDADKTLTDSSVMAVTTVLTAGSGGFLASLYKAGTIGSTTFAGAGIASGAIIGGSTSAGFRHSETSDDFRNFYTGAGEGALMGGGAAGKVLLEAKHAGTLAWATYKGLDMFAQSVGFNAAAMIREGKPIDEVLKQSFDPKTIVLGMTAQLTGEGVGFLGGALAGKLGATDKGLLQTFIRDTANAFGNGATGSISAAIDAEKERVSKAGGNEQISISNIIGHMCNAGLESMLSAGITSVGSHAIQSHIESRLGLSSSEHANKSAKDPRIEERVQRLNSFVSGEAEANTGKKSSTAPEPDGKRQLQSKTEAKEKQGQDPGNTPKTEQTQSESPQKAGHNEAAPDTNREQKRQPLKLEQEESRLSKLSKTISDEHDQTRLNTYLEAFKTHASMRQVPDAEIARTLSQVSELLEAKQSHLTAKQRAAVAIDIISNATEPFTIRQGMHPTCGTTQLSVQLYARVPSEAARVIKEAALSGQVKCADGSKVSIRPEDLHPDSETRAVSEHYRANPAEANSWEGLSGRSHADKILQNVLANVHWQSKMRGPDNTPHPRGEVHYRSVESKPGEFNEGVFAGGKKLSDDPHLYSQNLERIYHKVVGGEPIKFVIAHQELNSGNPTHAKISDSHVFSSMPEMLDLLRRLQPSERNPIIITNHTSTEPFHRNWGEGHAAGQGGFHVNSITGLPERNGETRVNQDNTWSAKAEYTADSGKSLSLKEAYLASLPAGSKEKIAILQQEVPGNPVRALEYYRELFNAGEMGTEAYKRQLNWLEKKMLNNPPQATAPRAEVEAHNYARNLLDANRTALNEGKLQAPAQARPQIETPKGEQIRPSSKQRISIDGNTNDGEKIARVRELVAKKESRTLAEELELASLQSDKSKSEIKPPESIRRFEVSDIDKLAKTPGALDLVLERMKPFLSQIDGTHLENIKNKITHATMNDETIAKVFERYTPEQRERLMQHLEQRKEHLSSRGLSEQFKKIAGVFETELKLAKEKNKQNGKDEPPGDTFIKQLHERDAKKKQINVLHFGESTAGKDLAYLFRKATGIKADPTVLREGQPLSKLLERKTDGQPKYVIFDSLDHLKQRKDGPALLAEIKQAEKKGLIYIPPEMQDFHGTSKVEGSGRTVNYHDLLEAHVERGGQPNGQCALIQKLDAIANVSGQTQATATPLDKNELSRLRTLFSGVDHDTEKLLSAKTGLFFLKELGLPEIDKTKTDGSRIRRESMQETARIISEHIQSVSPAEMIESFRNVHKQFLEKTGGKLSPEHMFVGTINKDKCGSSDRMTFWYRLANGLTGPEYDKHFQPQAAVKRKSISYVSYIDDMPGTGQQVLKRISALEAPGKKVFALVARTSSDGLRTIQAELKDPLKSSILFDKEHPVLIDAFQREEAPSSKAKEFAYDKMAKMGWPGFDGRTIGIDETRPFVGNTLLPDMVPNTTPELVQRLFIKYLGQAGARTELKNPYKAPKQASPPTAPTLAEQVHKRKDGKLGITGISMED